MAAGTFAPLLHYNRTSPFTSPFACRGLAWTLWSIAAMESPVFSFVLGAEPMATVRHAFAWAWII
jgi:hypothetical protein